MKYTQDPDKAKARFVSKKKNLAAFLSDDLSETDTRCKVIDAFLKDILGWDEQQIEREGRQDETGRYVDYELKTSRPIFIIEAKRNSVIYQLPNNNNQQIYKAGGVISEDKSFKRDLEQCRKYGIDQGVPFCCLTNGTQFFFFRPTNSEGIGWNEHDIYIFRDHSEIENDFSTFFALLSFDSVSNGKTFETLPVCRSSNQSGPKLYNIVTTSAPKRNRERNKLFPVIKEIIDEAFQDLSDKSASATLVQQCYVESPRDSSYGSTLEGLIKDRSIYVDTPTQTLNVSKKSAGRFDDVLRTNRDPEIILLLGGVGSGKSTFINRFRLVLAKNEIEENCIWSYINFNKFSDTGDSLAAWVCQRIEMEIEDNYPKLSFTDYQNLRHAYHREYERLKKGRLKPLFERDKDAFEIKFGEVLEDYEKQGITHLIRLLKSTANRAKRRLFLVFDNADQYEADVQNKIFQLAQQIAKETHSSAIISLREESYWRNKDFGTLSAFHAKTFHVQPPHLSSVFSKRFGYAKKKIEALEDHEVITLPEHGLITPTQLLSVFGSFQQTILAPDQTFVNFLECLSPGEVRRPLDQVAKFLYSGHTNVDSIVKAAKNGRTLTIGFHEFLTSIALGDQEKYTESTSDIVNLFRLRDKGISGSLSTILVASRIVSAAQNITESASFVPVTEVVEDCRKIGISTDTTLAILEQLNRKRFIETSNQIKENVTDSYQVRATAAAFYYLKTLGSSFAYVDLILTDVAITSEKFGRRLQEVSSKIDAITGNKPNDRVLRVEKRAERARVFAAFIDEEVVRQRTSSLPQNFKGLGTRFMEDFNKNVVKDAQIAIESARNVFS